MISTSLPSSARTASRTSPKENAHRVGVLREDQVGSQLAQFLLVDAMD
jgi:hypothetical protein